jgi:hypothetical protein
MDTLINELIQAINRKDQEQIDRICQDIVKHGNPEEGEEMVKQLNIL